MSIAYIREQICVWTSKVTRFVRLWSPSYPAAICLYIKGIRHESQLIFDSSMRGLCRWASSPVTILLTALHLPFAFQSTFPKFEEHLEIYIYISNLWILWILRRWKDFFFLFFYTYIYISLLKDLRSPFKCRWPPDRRGARLWWRSPTSCIQVENFLEYNDIFSLKELTIFSFLFPEKIIYPRNTRTLTKTAVVGGKPIDEKTCMVNPLIDNFLKTCLVNALLPGSKNLGFRKLCHSAEAGMGQDRLHVAPLRAKPGIWITSREKHDQVPRHGCASRDAQAFPLQI